MLADAAHAPYTNCRATRNGACASLRSFVSFEYVTFLGSGSSRDDARGRRDDDARARARARERLVRNDLVDERTRAVGVVDMVTARVQ
jgi:hypothetical protein